MTVLLIKGIFFAVLLITAAVQDLKKREILNLIPLLLLLVGLIRIDPLDACLGFLLTGLPYLLASVFVKRTDGFAIGGGDIKLMAACGFVLGIWGGIIQSVLSLTLAVTAGIIMALVRRKPFNEIQIPLAPCFCAGGIATYTVLLISTAFLI